MEKKSFLKGAAVLGVAGLLVQILGAFFRIPLVNIIGSEGMGYYQTAYPLYVFLLVFSTNGAPAAISKMVSERVAVGKDQEAYRVFKLSFLLMTAFGVLAALVFFFGAKPIVNLLGNPGAYYSVLAIAPALLFVPIMAVFRGYFQGLQRMEPTAVSQLCEQVVRVGVGLSAAYLLVPVGLEMAAAGASVGTSIGPIFGTLILLVIFLRYRKKNYSSLIGGDSALPQEAPHEDDGKESNRSIMRTLAIIAIPITIGVSIFPIMNIADVIIVMTRLQGLGYSEELANSLYGELSGLAGPIINIPQALALSIALSLVPAIAAAKSAGQKRELNSHLALGLRTASIVGMPCTFGLMLLSQPIMLLLYPKQAASAISAAPCLFYQGIGVIFLTLALAMAGMIQGLGRPGASASVLGVGVLVKMIATYFLMGIPSLNVAGAALANTIAFVAITILNYLVIKKMTGIKADFVLILVKPFLAACAMGVAVFVIYQGLSDKIGNTMSTAFSICIGAIVYVCFIILLKAVREEELSSMPMGNKIAKLLRKLGRSPKQTTETDDSDK